jgi:hypothetical protein
MSTVAYGALTARRKLSPAGTTKQLNPPGIGVWADSFTALVPAEVLVLHEYLVPLFAEGTEITSPAWALFTLLVVFGMSVVFYVAGMLLQAKRIFKVTDVGRLFLVWLALVCWMLTQQPSALDAIYVPSNTLRYVGVPIVAILLGLGAGILGANGADEASPDTNNFEAR